MNDNIESLSLVNLKSTITQEYLQNLPITLKKLTIDNTLMSSIDLGHLINLKELFINAIPDCIEEKFIFIFPPKLEILYFRYIDGRLLEQLPDTLKCLNIDVIDGGILLCSDNLSILPRELEVLKFRSANLIPIWNNCDFLPNLKNLTIFICSKIDFENLYLHINKLLNIQSINIETFSDLYNENRDLIQKINSIKNVEYNLIKLYNIILPLWGELYIFIVDVYILVKIYSRILYFRVLF